MHLLPVVITGLLTMPQGAVELPLVWEQMNNIEQQEGGSYRTTGPDPWILSEPLDLPIKPDYSILHIELKADQDAQGEVRWLMPGDSFVSERTLAFQVQSSEEYSSYYIDLAQKNIFFGLDRLRLDPSHGAGLNFSIRSIAMMRPEALPEAEITELIDFRGYTSKLHYLPGDTIEYQVRVHAFNYPDQSSTKTLDVFLLDADGNEIAHALHWWGIQPGYRIREISGYITPDLPLSPGAYTMKFVSEDLRSGLILEHQHDFAILADTDAFVYETPFKYIKDFSIIRDKDSLFHIFSITGDFYATHEWMPNGQERTLSHGTSRDLRHWTYHRPALSINDKTYPDSEIRYQDQGVWAPHVIQHDERYYLFYTSINTNVSQSISVAVSDDLYHWEEYEGNPVFNLDGVDWAIWSQDHWADCRDPMVFHDNETFYLYVTASVLVDSVGQGAVVVAESKDLFSWYNPQIACVTPPVPESPHVWKSGGNFYMYTSAGGGGVWESDNPVSGWKLTDIARVPTQEYAQPIPTSGGYAEEVLELEDGSILVAAATFRYFGNSIYIARLKMDENGRPVGYESPYNITEE